MQYRPEKSLRRPRPVESGCSGSPVNFGTWVLLFIKRTYTMGLNMLAPNNLSYGSLIDQPVRVWSEFNIIAAVPSILLAHVAGRP